MGIENTEKGAANMLLTREQLKACATGWLETREDEEGLIFFRIPEALHQRYMKRDEELAERSQASASVVLEFWTDARSVTVDLTVREPSAVCLCLLISTATAFSALLPASPKGWTLRRKAAWSAAR